MDNKAVIWKFSEGENMEAVYSIKLPLSVFNEIWEKFNDLKDVSQKEFYFKYVNPDKLREIRRRKKKKI